MKKIASCLLSAIIALSAMTALVAQAEDKDVYNNSDNSVSVKDMALSSDYVTVRIKNDKSGELVYINQKSDGFSDMTSFLLKSGCADGTYTAVFGSKTVPSKTINFFKGNINLTDEEGNAISVVLNTAQKMTVADEAKLQTVKEASDITVGGYKKGFTFLGSDLSGYDTAYLVSADGKTCYGYFTLPKPETEVSGYSYIAYGLQLFNIPAEKKDLNLYLGNKPTTSETETTGGAE